MTIITHKQTIKSLILRNIYRVFIFPTVTPTCLTGVPVPSSPPWPPRPHDRLLRRAPGHGLLQTQDPDRLPHLCHWHVLQSGQAQSQRLPAKAGTEERHPEKHQAWKETWWSELGASCCQNLRENSFTSREGHFHALCPGTLPNIRVSRLIRIWPPDSIKHLNKHR